MEKICKIVYFDEEAVTDYVQIVAGGELENTAELLKSKTASEEQEIEAHGKVGISGVFKALLGWDAGTSGSISGGISFNSNKMVKNIVKNTILTDFINVIEDSGDLGKASSRLPKGTIKKFKGYRITVEKDSLSHMVMVSPYLSMLKSGSLIAAGDYNIATDKLDKETIENTDILEWFINNAERYDNIRILKTKLENAIFDKLAETYIICPETKAKPT